MTDRTIETSAEAATTSDADPGEGLGLATPAAHSQGGAGDAGDMRVPDDDRATATDPASEIADGDTEGERSIRAAAVNRSQLDDSAGGAGSGGSRAGGQTPTDSDVAHSLD
jgi:hypothetical protein